MDARNEVLLREIPIPCLWLFGKTGSGKTSLIRYLTGASDAEIGTGFRPQTRQSRLYEFPDGGMPLLRFLDTRGLGEAAYDPATDIARFDHEAHLMIVTVRATDQALGSVIDPLREIQRSKPGRPVLLAITCLHDTYPGEQHPDPDPFDGTDQLAPEHINAALSRRLRAQHEQFEGLFTKSVPIDLTKPEDGFANPNFGGERLKRAILDLLPAAYRQTLLQMEHVRDALGTMRRQRHERVILAHSIVAASAAAVPLPWLDIPIVMAAQSHLLHHLASEHRQSVDARLLAKFTGIVGGRVALRMGLREVLKFIPWVGSAANAAAAFTYTYGSGKAANWYFGEIKAGHVPTAEELRRVYQQQLQAGANLWRTTPETPRE
jgi:uncharacterized protein (DUF697 family)